MWTILIFEIIGLIIGIALSSDMDLKDRFKSCFLTVLFFGFIGLTIGLFLDAETEKVSSYKRLEALQDGNNVNGTFFLGSGNINGSMHYVFYYEENGLFKMGQLHYNNVSINYVDENPMLETIKEIEKKESFKNNFAIDNECSFSEEHIIHVPKGTIKQNYNLDAQ